MSVEARRSEADPGGGERGAPAGSDGDGRRATLGDLLAILRPYRLQLAVATAVAAGAILAVVAIPLLVGKGVDEIQDGDKAGVVRAVIAIALVGLLGALSQGARQFLAGRLGLRVEYDLRQRYYSHLQELDLESIGELPTGQLVSRGTVDLRPIRFFLGAGIPSLAQDLGSILLAAVVMLTLDFDLALLTLAPLPLLVLAIVFYDRAATPRLEEVRQRIGELARIAQENVAGVRLVRAFDRERLELERFRSSAARMLAAAITATRIQARFTPTLAQIPTLALLVVLLYGGHQAIDREISTGEFTSFFTYALLLIGPAATIAYWMSMVQQAIAATDRINQILERPPRIASSQGSIPVASAPDVAFREVRADRRGRPALDGIELEIPSRRATAVIGGTGSGKSTLLQLINRLYDPGAGSVEIGGRPAADLDLTSLRQSVALATGDDFLFSGTVRENIAYGRPGASEEEIREAARRAQAAEFIEGLPDGYDTGLGSRGVGLSGGQAQRIAIARALLAGAEILLLDNATASLDAHTAREELERLSAHLREHTTVMVSYRTPSLALADEVIVLEHGRIVDRGTHQELLERSERYRALIEGDTRDQRASDGGEKG